MAGEAPASGTAGDDGGTGAVETPAAGGESGAPDAAGAAGADGAEDVAGVAGSTGSAGLGTVWQADSSTASDRNKARIMGLLKEKAEGQRAGAAAPVGRAGSPRPCAFNISRAFGPCRNSANARADGFA